MLSTSSIDNLITKTKYILQIFACPSTHKLNLGSVLHIHIWFKPPEQVNPHNNFWCKGLNYINFLNLMQYDEKRVGLLNSVPFDLFHPRNG